MKEYCHQHFGDGKSGVKAIRSGFEIEQPVEGAEPGQYRHCTIAHALP